MNSADRRIDRAANDHEDVGQRTRWSLAAALGAAVAASACCTIPLVLVSLGVGGAWIGSLTSLAPFRWIFVSIAAIALAAAGYNEWRIARKPRCDCASSLSPTTRRSLLGLAALAVVGLVMSPWLIPTSPSEATLEATSAASSRGGSVNEAADGTPMSYQQVVLNVDGMTCATCPVTVRNVLKRVDGVYSVQATLQPPQAVVRFDPAKTTVELLAEATAAAGFPSALTSSN